MSRLYLVCAVCSRRQADGLISGAAWGRAELPPGAEERDHDGIRFIVYRRAGLTLVFWEEGTVVCVLASDGDPEEAVQLAYAKAVRVA